MNYLKNLKKKILKNKACIGIIGLGYVGLPLSILFSKKGYKVYGFDIDKSKIKKINLGVSYINRISKENIQRIKKKGFFSSNFKKISECDIIIICVPTPLKNEKPYVGHIENTIKSIKKFLKEGQVIVLESTSYPGTTDELIKKKLNKKFIVGKNFFIGFSSERINPGFNESTLSKIPKVVSGFSDSCKKIIFLFYSRFFSRVVLASKVEVAEFSKLLENIYRAVNISFINEMKLIANRFDLDIFEIIKIASTKPFGFSRFDPGPGTGGHCIPVDPKFLSFKSRQYGFNPKFIELAAKTNIKILTNITNIIQNDLRKRKINFKNSKILILGVSYKKNVDDLRESASLRLIKILQRKKIKKIDYSDPYHRDFIKTRSLVLNKKGIKISSKNIKKYDLVILMTNHDKFNYRLIYKNAKKIIDTRGVFSVDHKVIRG